MYSSTVDIFQPLSAVLSFSAGVNCYIPAMLISSPTQLFSVSQKDLLLYSVTVNLQLYTAFLRLLARNKYSFPVLTCIISCILFFLQFLINEPIFSGHLYITDTAGFLLGPGHRDLYSAILIFVPAIFTLSLY